MLPHFASSEFLAHEGFGGQATRLGLVDGRLDFPSGVMNAYFASVAADMIRQKLLERKATFTF